MNPRLVGVLMIAIGAMLAFGNQRAAEDLVRNRQTPAWARLPLRVSYVAFGVFAVLAGFGLLVGWLPA